MNKRAPLLSILSVALLFPAGCGDYLDLEPDDPPPPDAPLPDPSYPPLPPLEAFPDEPVVTTPGEAPAPPPGAVDEGVHLLFPPPVSITAAREVTVRGTARLAGGVTAVRVNGVAARLSAPGADGAVAWQASVQITSGTSALVVSGEGGGGGITPAAGASITFSPDRLIRPRDMDLDVAHDRLFVSDAERGLVVIDLATGTSTSVPLAESPDRAWVPFSLSVAPASGRALSLSRHSACSAGSSLMDVQGVVVDLQDGNTDSVDEFEPVPDCSKALYTEDEAVVLDAAGESFFYLHYGEGSEANRVEVRRRPLGDGAPAPMSLPLCAENRCSGVDMIATRRDQPGQLGLLALVLHEDQGAEPSYAVHAIDPVEGSQTRVVTVQTDWNSTESQPRALAIDPDRERLFVLALSPSSELYVIGVNLATGGQSLLYAGQGTVDGSDTWTFVDAIHDPRRDRLIVSDEIRGLITLDLASGEIDRLYRPAIGDGPVPACPLHDSNTCNISTLDSERQRLFVHARDNGDGSDIYVLDLATGNRRLLSPNDNGLQFGYAPRLFADDVEDRLLVLHEEGGLSTVDGVTGERAQVGHTDVPARWDADVAWDPAQNRILYYAHAERALRAVNVDTLEDRVISADGVGSGPSLGGDDDVPFREATVLLDASGTRALVSHLELGIVISVDLATGDRTSHAVDVPDGPGVGGARQPLLADTHRNRLLIGESPRHAISAIDLSTGAITTFVDAYRTDPPLRLQTSMFPDHASDRALIIDERYEVYMLDMVTGQRALIMRNNNAPPADL